MNCANHPERTATAFCQNCGKPLCPECVRSADGLILCEPCLLTRAAAAASSASSATAPNPGGGGAWQPVTQPGAHSGAQTGPHPGAAPGVPLGYVPVSAASQTSPGLAALLGFIPGVGAMYNGQFVKALLHVIIFIVLIGTTEHLPLVGILIAAWVFYQVFDASQTAAARRDGRPLPDPFGILDMSHRFGPQQPSYPATQFPGPPNGPPTGAPAAAQAPHTQYAPQSQYAGQYAGPPQPYVPAPVAPAGYPPMQPVPYPPQQRRGEPVGAIVLIAVGLLLLLSTLGVLDVDWIWRGWPVLVLLLGVWLLFRRATGVPATGSGFSAPMPSGPAPSGPVSPAAADPAAATPVNPAPFSPDNPLSITPRTAGTAEEETR